MLYRLHFLFIYIALIRSYNCTLLTFLVRDTSVELFNKIVGVGDLFRPSSLIRCAAGRITPD
jgi:hypothetical protein